MMVIMMTELWSKILLMLVVAEAIFFRISRRKVGFTNNYLPSLTARGCKACSADMARFATRLR